MSKKLPHFCRECGHEFNATGPRQLRCPDCDHEPLPLGKWRCITRTRTNADDTEWFGFRYDLASWRHLSIPHGAILWCIERGDYMQVRRIGDAVLFESCDAPKTTCPVPTTADLLDGQFCHRAPGRMMKAKVY